MVVNVDVLGSPVKTPPVQVYAVPEGAALATPVAPSTAITMTTPNKERNFIT
ncbi:MAG TPA: hypothetical protein VI159_08200 [Gemmatimonadales bacterium]